MSSAVTFDEPSSAHSFFASIIHRLAGRSLIRQFVLPTCAFGAVIFLIVTFYTPAAVIDAAIDEAVQKGSRQPNRCGSSEPSILRT